jgi:hypothetical protein
MGKAIHDSQLLSDKRKAQGGGKYRRTHPLPAADSAQHTSRRCIGIFT